MGTDRTEREETTVPTQLQPTNPLGELFECLARRELDAFLAGCSEEMVLTARGVSAGSTVVTRHEFRVWFESMRALTGETLETEVSLALSMDNEHVVILRHSLWRDGELHSYLTLNRCTFADGLLRGWYSNPMHVLDYCTAWGTWETDKATALR